ncbi:MAG: SAM-dependent methyltransferase [Spirochaetaceae bacterium]|nr:SAM-dependent methyltransferase [Spirochaetaceae bacterium]
MEDLKQNFNQKYAEISQNLVSATFAKPTVDSKFNKIKININNHSFFVQMYTSTQAFHKNLSNEELKTFLQENIGVNFKHVYIETNDKKFTFLTNKKGKITLLENRNNKNPVVQEKNSSNNSKIKNYIIQEGKPVPFLVHLGVMNKEGKVLAQKYDKFKQINRFLEYIKDILPEINNGQTLKIIDFGCGKSYLTFAVYHFINEIEKIPVEIIGLDLKDDVITMCNLLAKEFGYKNLHFYNGTVEDYFAKIEDKKCDLVITLHACDTATDYAIASAIKQNSKAILSVPCCQHELNQNYKQSSNQAINQMLKYGIVKERFLSLTTDVMRCELLKEKGYSTQLLEFIDVSHTPKNLLIRAVKKKSSSVNENSNYKEIAKLVGQDICLAKLLESNIY